MEDPSTQLEIVEEYDFLIVSLFNLVSCLDHGLLIDLVIKNPFWCIYNLNHDFISLELIILERENTMEAW